MELKVFFRILAIALVLALALNVVSQLDSIHDEIRNIRMILDECECTVFEPDSLGVTTGQLI